MLPGAVLLVQQARFLAAIPLVNGNASRVPLQNLTQPLPTKDGGVLRTIGEAVAYMASPPEEETRSLWQLAADAILKQAPVAEVVHRIDLALFYDAKLDLNAWQTIGAMMHASSENEPLYDAAVLRALIADALLFRNTPDQVRDWIDGFN